jgi:RNA polymerase sigma-70 factor (ECF subfamily)
MVDLIRLAQTGDMEATARLVEEHRRIIFKRLLACLHDKSDADDLFQQVYFRVHSSIKGLQDPEKFIGWVLRIASRLAFNRNRDERRRKVYEHSGGAEFYFQEDLVVKKEIKKKVHEILSSLRPIYRDSLTEFYINGKDVKTICREFGLKKGTVKRRLFAAREMFREVYND